ncbi:MAG: hypothetical protein SF162_12330 [bacterium]|nr:hypothetical protein [bacterium]
MKRFFRLALVSGLSAVLIGTAGAFVSANASVDAEASTIERFTDLLRQDASAGDAALFAGKNIYFAETSGEPSRFDRSATGISMFGALLRGLGANLYALDWRQPFPDNIDVIVIPNPASDYTADQLSRLWAHMNGGGRVFMALNPVTDRAARERGAFAGSNGLFLLLNADFGLTAVDNMVAVETEGDAGTTLGIRFNTSDVDAHPITENLSGPLEFAGARSVTVNTPLSGGAVTPLIYAPEGFYGESAFQAYIDTGAYNFDIGADTTPGRIPLAAVYENPATGTRLFLIGDRDFIANGVGFAVSPTASLGFVYPNNVIVALQAMAWLLESNNPVLAFPTPAATATPTITPSPLPPTPTPTPTGAPATPTAGS